MTTGGGVRVLIVDDERLSRAKLRRLVEQQEDFVVVGECANGEDATAAIVQEQPDVVLLDIRMPRMTGFEVLQSIGAGPRPFVVFVTAHEEHALSAFDVHAVDYILKPVSAQRVAAALEHVRELVELRRGASAPQTDEPPVPAARFLQHIPIRRPGRVTFVPVDTVEWFEAVDNYVRLHGRDYVHMVRERLGTFEKSLDPAQFARIHRSSIVNLRHVVEMRPWTSGECRLTMASGAVLKVSRSYRHQIAQLATITVQ